MMLHTKTEAIVHKKKELRKDRQNMTIGVQSVVLICAIAWNISFEPFLIFQWSYTMYVKGTNKKLIS